MPEISIVVPIYNVEKYLSECLDSVRGQTLRDIEIIAVNDGSTDSSPEILEEHATRDSRIVVIHKPNGGLSSARNAAYPSIRGRYVLFVDSDDYIEPVLCEKTLAVAEREDADMTFFFFRRTPGETSPTRLETFLKHRPFSEVDKETLLGEMTAWSKLWKTEFLLGNDIRFPEGICFEDNVAHWQALLRNPKIAVLNERLYWYRVNLTSISQNAGGRTFFDIVPCYEKIRKILVRENKYSGEWKRLFLTLKLRRLYCRFLGIAPVYRPEMLDVIQGSIGNDEREYLSSPNVLGPAVRAFYRSLGGSIVSTVEFALIRVLQRLVQRTG